MTTGYLLSNPVCVTAFCNLALNMSLIWCLQIFFKGFDMFFFFIEKLEMQLQCGRETGREVSPSGRGCWP